MSNFIDFTSLTYEEILSAIKSKLAANSNFDNFRESAIAQLCFEIFAGAVDMCNYNLERRAEECYFDTAKLRSSAILLSKQLGYVLTRPIPAESQIKIKLTGDLTSKNIQTDDVLQIPIYNNFQFDGNTYLLKDTFSYTFTSADVVSISADGESYEKILTSGDNGTVINVIQGDRETRVIEGETNNQVGQKFQIYKIEDLEFSNQFGSEDYDVPITTVKVGRTSATATSYDIDRRSLINLESIENFVVGDTKNVCVVRTANDENIEILFGDAQYAALGATVSANGPTTTYDNIYIDYLSTKGAAANKTGIIDQKLTSNTPMLVDGNNITSNIEYLFNTNIVGGADMEDLESIKLNAPSIYYSLDRLVSNRDYVAYLKSLTSPINIKNAIVWGEQEEMNLTDNNPIKKLFNLVLFSVLGSLYNLTGTIYTPKTNSNNLNTAVLDLDYNENELKNQNYFNVYVKQNVVQQLNRYATSGTYHVLYGDSDVDITVADFVTNYDNHTFPIDYRSDLTISAVNGREYTSAINISAATTEAEIATGIQNAVRGFKDLRGSSTTNSNYNNNAFQNMLCKYDSTNDRFILSGHPNDANYIYQLTQTIGSPGYDFLNAIGWNGNLSESVTSILNNSGNILSSKITNVVNKLDVKSQVTVKHVYISPIIQNFNLNGNIYVNKLADKEDLHRKIKNAVYTWADTNADFNKDVYLSNIIEIVEAYPNVNHANLSLSGTPVTYTAFNATTNTILNKPLYADETTLQTEFTNYYNILNADLNLTERLFFSYTKNLYDNLTSTNNNHTPFRDTEDFNTVISDIHKNFALRIKDNLLDSSGNITEYTIGNEAVKITANTTILYKT